MSENLFRIGGVYRDVGGEVTRVNGPHQGVWREDGTAWCEVLTTWGEWWGCGYRRLSDGIDPSGYRRIECDNSERHLLPGELHCVNGEWVPIEDPELVALQTRPQHEPASVEEEKREPLTWNKPATVDRFPGFTVSSGSNDVMHVLFDGVHAIQRMTDADYKAVTPAAGLVKVR